MCVDSTALRNALRLVPGCKSRPPEKVDRDRNDRQLPIEKSAAMRTRVHNLIISSLKKSQWSTNYSPY